MLAATIAIVLFTGLILYNLFMNLFPRNIIEGLETATKTAAKNESKELTYIPPKDTTEYTQAEVAAKLEELLKKVDNYQKQMMELSSTNEKLAKNTEAIAALQVGLADMEGEVNNMN